MKTRFKKGDRIWFYDEYSDNGRLKVKYYQGTVLDVYIPADSQPEYQIEYPDGVCYVRFEYVGKTKKQAEIFYLSNLLLEEEYKLSLIEEEYEEKKARIKEIEAKIEEVQNEN